MKTLLTILILFFSLNLSAQIYVHAGTSPIKGLIGLELQPINHFSISGGYRFTRFWSVGDIHSFSGSLNYYFMIEPALLYVSVGAASKGIIIKNEYDMWTTPVPAEYLMVGTRFYPNMYAPRMTDRLSFDIGMGVSTSKYTSPDLVIDFEVNFIIFKLRKINK